MLAARSFVTPDRNKTYEEMVSDESLDEIATYATGVGPWKNMLLVPSADGTKLESTGLTAKLQNRGMQVSALVPGCLTGAGVFCLTSAATSQLVVAR